MSKLTLMFKGKVLKVLPLGDGELVIGSDPGCGLHIDSLAVHGRHARIRTAGGKSVLSDLGSAEGTFVNNQRIDGEHALKDEDIIRVGKHNLAFSYEAPLGAAPPREDGVFSGRSRTSGWLQILTGSNVGKTLSLNRNMVNLGKPGVQTAIIVRRNEGYFLSHLEGDAAPRVNGREIGEHAWHLQDGDVIQMGNVKMQFYLQ